MAQLTCIYFSRYQKNVFVNGHECLDVIKDRVKFLMFMKKLEPYLVEFEKNYTIKAKIYPRNCNIRRENQRLIICITHDEFTFLANDSKKFAWQKTGDTLLKPKEKDQRIMISDFLLPFKCLSFSHLTDDNQNSLSATTNLIETEAVEVFEYRKNDNEY